jgi:uncharacterized RDD family membrane protein YckC
VDREQLHIAGLTGVDVALDIAGAGTRSYAFILDWHIRVLFALGWYCLVWALVWGVGAITLLGATPRWFFAVAGVPAILIYVFYHPVLEVLMRGRTPGKRRAGVRIVLRNGGTPGIGPLLVRNIFRLVDTLPAFYLLGLVCCLTTEQRVRIGDLAAGTVLIRDSQGAAQSLSQLAAMVTQSQLRPELVELIRDLLERWPELELKRRDEIARSILARADRSGSDAQLALMSDEELLRQLRALVSLGAGQRA